MKRPARTLLIVAAVMLGLGLFAAPQAQAGWWHGYYGYYGWSYPSCSYYSSPVCSVSVCDPCCDGWYLGVRPGPIRRLLFGPYRWYRSYGCCSVCYCDPCCCYDPCYDPCCYDTVVSVGSTREVQSSQKPTLAPQKSSPDQPKAGTPNEPAPAPTPPPTPKTTFDASPDAQVPEGSFDFSPAPADPATKPEDDSADPLLPDATMPDSAVDPLAPQAAIPSSEGTISILVPEGARVVINGYVTKSTGRVRRYVAQDLKPGLVYPFNIQVNVVREGRTLTETRRVKLTGGTLEAVVFDFDKSSVDRVAQAW